MTQFQIDRKNCSPEVDDTVGNVHFAKIAKVIVADKFTRTFCHLLCKKIKQKVNKGLLYILQIMLDWRMTDGCRKLKEEAHWTFELSPRVQKLERYMLCWTNRSSAYTQDLEEK